MTILHLATLQRKLRVATHFVINSAADAQLLQGQPKNCGSHSTTATINNALFPVQYILPIIPKDLLDDFPSLIDIEESGVCTSTSELLGVEEVGKRQRT